MKRITFIIIASAVFLYAHAPSAHASKILDQFTSGAKDFVTAPVELGIQTNYYINEHHDEPAVGAIAGVLEGAGSMVAKFIRGTFKMVSAPFAGMEPEFKPDDDWAYLSDL